MAAIHVRSGLSGQGNVEAMTKLHRSLVNLYSPDDDIEGEDRERVARMQEEFDKVPETFQVRMSAATMEGEFNIG